MNLFLENVSKYVSLTPEEEHILLGLMHSLTVKSKTVLLKQGQIAKETYFVTKGILRSYTLDDHGVERIVSFASPQWFISDMYSLHAEAPGNLYIDAIVDSEVLVIKKEDQEKMYDLVPKMERFFRILIEKNVVANQQRMLDNLTLTAETRYQKFCKKHPDLIHCLPQKQVASYIGVTPEFFSKMKSNWIKKIAN